jgi:hypothetical protein
MSGRNRSNAVRQRLTYEAARIMAEQGLADYEAARRKAAERLGVADRKQWPKNSEIQTALLEHQRLFRPREQASELRRMREEALGVMRALERFRPRLVGAALDGTAGSHSGIRLHLFADSSEEILLELMERGLRWQQLDLSLLYGGGQRKIRPALRLQAHEVAVELVLLPLVDLRNPPLSPVTERPERGAGVEQVRALLDAEAEQQAGNLAR